jgi:hypothetical protein
MSIKNNAARAIAQAAREASAAETRRCAEITELCTRMGQPGEMTTMILSGKSPTEVEVELKSKANAASWAQAAAKAGVAP